MADEKKQKAAATSADVKVSEGLQIIANGPVDEWNNAKILRYQPDDHRKKSVDIQAGQILTVGQDITVEDADRLLGLETWNFERVSE